MSLRDIRAKRWFVKTYEEIGKFTARLSSLTVNDSTLSIDWIYHDKDTYEDGTAKKPHIHAIIQYNSIKRGTTVKNELGGESVGLHLQKCDNSVSVYRYLTHEDDLQKYQYPASEIQHIGAPIYYEERAPTPLNEGEQILDMRMLIHQHRYKELIKLYGKQALFNLRNLQLLDNLISQEEREEFQIIHGVCRVKSVLKLKRVLYVRKKTMFKIKGDN